MEDKYLMENILYASKVLNDLYMHGVIEASNDSVATLFNKIVGDTLKMHNEIYKEMESAGFYTTKNVDKSKIKELKDKISCTCSECDCEED